MSRSNWNLLLILLVPAVLLVGCNQAGGEAASEEGVPSVVEKLFIKDEVVGDGVAAVSGDYVKAHYTGWIYTDGEKIGEPFDSSLTRGEPAVFPIGAGRLIKGWDEGIPGMKVGGKRVLIIPPDMAYGDTARPNIPAGSTLYFEVELVEVPRVQTDDQITGDGPTAAIGDMVKVHYTGWLQAEDGSRGEKFDSSLDRGEPFSFPLGGGRVIAGWDIGVQGMQVGGKRLLTIPSDLGYGASGAGGAIPPNANLIFEVELLEVVGK